MLRTVKKIAENFSNQNKISGEISKLFFCGTSVKCLSSDSGKTVDIKYNFHKDCEEGLNKQINLEFSASYTYFCMATCLSRPDVALHGFAQFFSRASTEERQHGTMMAEYINMRGGSVQLLDIAKPNKSYHDPVFALQEAIDLERKVLKAIEELHKTADTHNDLHLTDFLEAHFIPEGYEGIKQLLEMLTNVQRAGPGVGLVLLNLDMIRHPPDMHGIKK